MEDYNARTPSFTLNSGPENQHGFQSSFTPTGSNSSGSSSGSGFPSIRGNGIGGGSGSGGGSGGREEALQFDVISWYPKYQSCQRYFLEVAQHSYPCQALAAFINIKLPFQRAPVLQGPVSHHMPSSSSARPPQYRSPGMGGFPTAHPHPTISQFGWVSLHPYMRRLVATGFDVAAILHGWFGDDWEGGVGPLHEQERRNYMFAAKSGGWKSVKKQYDEVIDEAVPYLIPLSKVQDSEIEGAESLWSRWLAMEDWMLGTRAPTGDMQDDC